MLEFEILWSPLSRKWQVWQRQTDNNGCKIETLLGEYSSEGRANHEAGVLRGDLPSDAVYQPPVMRRWFLPRKRRMAELTAPSQTQDNPHEIIELPATPMSDSNARRDESRSISTGTDMEDWQRDLILRIELLGRLVHKKEIESVRRLLEETLRSVPTQSTIAEAA